MLDVSWWTVKPSQVWRIRRFVSVKAVRLDAAKEISNLSCSELVKRPPASRYLGVNLTDDFLPCAEGRPAPLNSQEAQTWEFCPALLLQM